MRRWIALTERVGPGRAILYMKAFAVVVLVLMCTAAYRMVFGPGNSLAFAVVMSIVSLSVLAVDLFLRRFESIYKARSLNFTGGGSPARESAARVEQLENRLLEFEKTAQASEARFVTDRLELATLGERTLLAGIEQRWVNLIRLSIMLVMSSLLVSAVLVWIYLIGSVHETRSIGWSRTMGYHLDWVESSSESLRRTRDAAWRAPFIPTDENEEESQRLRRTISSSRNHLEALPEPVPFERDWRVLLAATTVPGLFLGAAGVLARLARGQAEQRTESLQRVANYERMSFAVEFAERVSTESSLETINLISRQLVSEVGTGSSGGAEADAGKGGDEQRSDTAATLSSAAKALEATAKTLKAAMPKSK